MTRKTISGVALSVLAAAMLVACNDKTSAPGAGAKPALGEFGIDTAQMDKTVKPGDDFFKYVNGKWLSTFTIPADRARFGAFDKLGEAAENDVRTILDDLAKTPPADGTVARKVADLYGSWMDEAAIEALGVEPLKPVLADIEAATTKADILKLMGRPDFSSPIGAYIDTDPVDSTKYAVWITQSGLGMPNRDYYLENGGKYPAYREAYKAYVTRIFELSGDAAPAKSAADVIALETKIAKIHWTNEDRRDVDKTTNPMTLAGLKKLAPAIDWPTMFDAAGLAGLNNVVVGETTAITGGAKLIASEPVAVWKKYLAFHIASDNAAYLPKAFDQASFDFFRKTLSGIETQRDRWKRGVGLVNNLVGEGVGEVYVKTRFTEDQKSKMDALVANLREALKSRLQTLAWMDEPTRKEALAKLATFDPRIGYPSKWRDYSALQIAPGKLFENVRAANEFEWKRQVGRLNQPVDRTEWAMNPQTVNAYYDAAKNQITFPAAILQPPFFDANADPAVNYGAIGAVIGHEIGHGFDDQGSKYDEKGVVRNWWTPDSRAKFEAQTAMFGAQYAAFCPYEGACVKPKLTMGENIGDLGGIEMAYTAYKLSLAGQEAPVIDGFTGDQRFFMAWAQVWQAISREDDVRQRLATDPHSPPEYRVNGVVRNVDAWYEAFGVKEGDKLYLKPEDRVHIW